MMRLHIKEIRGQQLFIWCWTASSTKANCKYITAAYNEQVCINLRGEGSKPAPKNAQASEERIGRLWSSHKRPMPASPTAFVIACRAIRKTPHSKRWTTAWWHCSHTQNATRCSLSYCRLGTTLLNSVPEIHQWRHSSDHHQLCYAQFISSMSQNLSPIIESQVEGRDMKKRAFRTEAYSRLWVPRLQRRHRPIEAPYSENDSSAPTSGLNTKCGLTGSPMSRPFLKFVLLKRPNT